MEHQPGKRDTRHQREAACYLRGGDPPIGSNDNWMCARRLLDDGGGKDAHTQFRSVGWRRHQPKAEDFMNLKRQGNREEKHKQQWIRNLLTTPSTQLVNRLQIHDVSRHVNCPYGPRPAVVGVHNFGNGYIARSFFHHQQFPRECLGITMREHYP